MAGAALQGGELDGAALALQLVVDELGKIAAGAAEDGLVAKGVQLTGGGNQIAQIRAVCSLYALAGCDDNVGLYPLQLVHPGKELVLIKGYFRQQDQVGAFAVLTACQTGRTGQPACMATHDLGHRHAADVVHRGVADDLFQNGGNVLCGRAVAGGVVGETQIVVDSLGHTDEPHTAAHLLPVAGQLCDGVHRVVAADVEEVADVQLFQNGEQLFVDGFVGVPVGQLVAAAAQIAGRGALEQLDAHAVVQQNVELQQLFLEQTLDAVLHAVHLVCTQTAGGFVYARKAGVDHGGRAAALTNDHILGHEYLLLQISFLSFVHRCRFRLPRRQSGVWSKGPALPADRAANKPDAASDTKIFAACVFAFCKMCKISCNPIVPVLPVVCKTQLVAQAKKI